MSTDNSPILENTLILNYEDAYRPKIESEKELWRGINKEIYFASALLVDSIISKSEQNTSEIINQNMFKLDFQANNIVAFVGDRGSGKTSAILSFINWLSSDTRKVSLEKYNNLTETVSPKIESLNLSKSEYKFFPISMIDPSAFHGEERIIEVIIAKMYNSFTKEMKDGNRNDYHELVKSFQQVYQALKIVRTNGKELLKDDDYSEFALESLSNLAMGAELNTRFEYLVKQYLQFTSKGNHINTSYLVIAIDDIDVHINDQVQLLEDIRKYLKIPNLIIFMGVRLEQISANLEVIYNEKYKAADIFETAQTMASKYLEKLIPGNCKMVMPLSNFGNTAVKKALIYKKEGKVEIEAFTIQDAVINYVFRKTGLALDTLIYHDIHPIVPRSIRELHDLLNILYDYDNSTDRGSVLSNFDKFLNYLLGSWAITHIPRKLLNFVEEVNNANDENLNKLITTNLSKIAYAYVNDSQLTARSSDFEISFSEIKIVDTGNLIIPKENLSKIFSSSNNPENVGYGDTIALIKIIRDYYRNSDIDKLAFLISTILTNRILTRLIIRNKYPIINFGNLFPPELISFYQTRSFTSFEGSNYDSVINEFKRQLGNNENIKSSTILAFLEIHKFIVLSEIDRNIKNGIYDTGLSIIGGGVNNKKFHFSLLHYLHYSINPIENLHRIIKYIDDFPNKEILEPYLQPKYFQSLISVELIESVVMQSVSILKRRRLPAESNKLLKVAKDFLEILNFNSNKIANRFDKDILNILLPNQGKTLPTLLESDSINNFFLTLYRSMEGDQSLNIPVSILSKEKIKSFITGFRNLRNNKLKDEAYLRRFQELKQFLEKFNNDESASKLLSRIYETELSFRSFIKKYPKDKATHNYYEYSYIVIDILTSYINQ